MKIVHIITRLIIGGAQENTVLTCQGLAELGHDVVLVSGPETGPEGSLWDKAGEAGCDLIKLDSMRRAVRPMTDYRAYRDLIRLLTRHAPDIVHTHSSKAGIIGRFAAATARVPHIVHTIHGMSFNRTQPASIQWLYKALERRAARHTDSIVCVANAMTDQAVAAGLADRARFTTVRSGMRTEQFAPDPQKRSDFRKAWGVADDTVVVGTIARLFANKGYEEIIEAMPAAVAACPQLHFVWIGHGAHKARYETQLRSLGLADRVTFTGLIDPNEVGAHLAGVDIVLHASRWEGLPRALVQGLLTETPAISFDNDGAPEVVIPDRTGILVPQGDTTALAAAIAHLADRPDLRTAYGQAGRALCLELFDWRRMVDDLDRLYQTLTRK